MKTVLVIYLCLLGTVPSLGVPVSLLFDFAWFALQVAKTIYDISRGNCLEFTFEGVQNFSGNLESNMTLNPIDTNINDSSYRLNEYSAPGKFIASGYLRTYATWMNELRPEIESYRMIDMRQLFKSLGQDIQTQLEDGNRYIVIRPAYDTLLAGGPFYIDQGITKIPISQIIDDIKNFIAETKEIIVVVIKDFSEEFNESSVHDEFVGYVREKFEGLFVNPILTWIVPLGELWEKQQFIFLSYDDEQVVKQFNDTLFSSVDHILGDNEGWQKYFKHALIDIAEEHTAIPLANSTEEDSEIVPGKLTGITMLNNSTTDSDIHLITVYMMEFKNISGIPWTVWSNV